MEAQPGMEVEFMRSWLNWLVALSVLLGLLVVLGMLWALGGTQGISVSGEEYVGQPEGDEEQEILESPCFRHVQAGSSTDVLPQQVVVPQFPQEASPEGESLCQFPEVGRIDVRANWVPAHYMRYLLSAVGGELFLALGLDGGEIWRLRQVARTFRYGVASAYEKAQGAGERRSGAREARFLALPEVQLANSLRGRGDARVPDEVQEDEGVDAVRHVFPEVWEGPDLQDRNAYRSSGGGI